MDDIQALRRLKREETRQRLEEERRKRSLERQTASLRRRDTTTSSSTPRTSGLSSSIRQSSSLPPRRDKDDEAHTAWLNRRKDPPGESSRPLYHKRTAAATLPVRSTIQAASPASDISSVTYSEQSPRKQPAKTSKPAPAEEEEEDDLVAFALQLEAQRKQKKKQSSKPAAKAKSAQTDDDDDDFVLPPLNPLSSSSFASPSRKRKHSDAAAEALDVADEQDDDDDDDEDDPFIQAALRISRRKKAKERRQHEEEEREHKEEERRKLPRNPIALTKRKIAEVTPKKSFPAAKDDDDSLFDTDEEEEKKREEEEKEKKKRKPRKKPAKSEDTPDKPKKARGRRKSRDSIDSHASADFEAEPSDDDADAIDYTKRGFKPDEMGPDLIEPTSFEPLRLPYGENSEYHNEVPAPMNRYLKDYQRTGVEFMHSCIIENRGSLLADDMGLGKTVQVLGLLSALLKKTGSEADAKELKRRRRRILQKKRELDHANENALLEGRTVARLTEADVEFLDLPQWAPILVIVPASVLATWEHQCERWGYFGVASYKEQSRSLALDSVRSGHNEILLCGKPLFCQLEGFQEIMSVPWRLVIVDEYHQCKNPKSVYYKCLSELKSTHECPILGMTGTLMQNNHEELWSLVNLVAPGLLGTAKEFRRLVSAPIKYGRTKTAQGEVIEMSKTVQHILENEMKTMYLHRTKEAVLGDQLPVKDQSVIFCQLEPIQKQLYEHILSLADYRLLKYMFAPCDCGVNRSFFTAYKRIGSDRERIEYLRRHKDDITPRKKCCFSTPTLEGDHAIDPQAVLWRTYHEDDEECERCPDCLLFPALHKLLKVCSHAALLQARGHPISYEVESTNWKAATKELDFAKVALPPEIVSQLPGGSYVRDDSFLEDHLKLSGKMRVLAKLLARLNKGDNRVLIFCTSTMMLSLIEHYAISQGYTYLRLDGQVPTRDRQALIRRFQEDDHIFLFLISTKAGGLGLNLTAANVVIIFDASYNPSHDDQAEDRAYRIGQRRDVRVFRLVSQGTVEELIYIRQIYKIQLKQETLPSEKRAQSARLFHGVSGDANRKGELFGTVNLLKFKDGSFMDDIWKSADDRSAVGQPSSSGTGGLDERNVADLSNAVQNLSADELEHIERRTYMENFEQVADQAVVVNSDNDVIEDADKADIMPDDVEEDEENELDIEELVTGNVLNHKDFFNAERGDAALKPGDEGFEEEMGGCSQIAHEVCEHAEVDDTEEPDKSDLVNSAVVPDNVASTSVTTMLPDPVMSTAAAVPSPVISHPVVPSPVRSYAANVAPRRDSVDSQGVNRSDENRTMTPPTESLPDEEGPEENISLSAETQSLPGESESDGLVPVNSNRGSVTNRTPTAPSNERAGSSSDPEHINASDLNVARRLELSQHTDDDLRIMRAQQEPVESPDAGAVKEPAADKSGDSTTRADAVECEQVPEKPAEDRRAQSRAKSKPKKSSKSVSTGPEGKKEYATAAALFYKVDYKNTKKKKKKGKK